MATLSRFLRHSEKTSGTSGRASEPRTLDSTFSPPKMMGTLLMSLVSCLIAISQASLINRCDLARVLYKEDLDGFEGYSLTDCECCFSHSPLPHFSSSSGMYLHPPSIGPLNAASTFDPAKCLALGFAQFLAHTRHPLKTLFSLFKGLCLAFVESKFNISKVNENADGSFDYGIFQINSHYWCNDYRSHSEDICHEDCQGLARAPGWERPTEPQSSLNHQLCKKDCVQSRGDEELVRRTLVAWRLHCAGRPLSYWMTGCFLG
ncbi:hypothetical protein GH733_016274 [Mirounga leonina]|nr:hypothetical protein GH733_016274 [Mirounga leonina]